MYGKWAGIFNDNSEWAFEVHPIDNLIHLNPINKNCLTYFPGFCVAGFQYEKTRKCSMCPVDTFNNDNGTKCYDCKHGYDTNGMTGATACTSKLKHKRVVFSLRYWVCYFWPLYKKFEIPLTISFWWDIGQGTCEPLVIRPVFVLDQFSNITLGGFVIIVGRVSDILVLPWYGYITEKHHDRPHQACVAMFVLRINN